MNRDGIIDEIQKRFIRNEDNILLGQETGYWSNLDQNENDEFIRYLKKAPSVRDAVMTKYPQCYDVIFSPKREAGLEFLELKGTECCIDYGCMWGALTLPLAKRARFVLGVDQTLQSLVFLRHRIENENLKNIDLLCENLNKMPIFDFKFDVAIVNGVLEWIPERGKIELNRYFGKKNKKNYNFNPKVMQIDFLKNVYANLNSGGKLYLAIENRYDFKMFFGVKDPHADLMFTSIFPRKLANFISMQRLGRPYVNWLYSFSELNNILKSVGFYSINLYCCFPDYRFPEFISQYEHKLKFIKSTITAKNADGKIRLRRAAGKIIELVMFKYLKTKYFAPSIIAVAKKN